MSRKSSINKIKRDNSKSKNIEAALCLYLYEKSHSPITTHFSGSGLSECDVISISKSNYIYEYEVKISRSDYKKDFIKEKHNLILNEKHTMLSHNGDLIYLLPSYFSFVTVKDLIRVNEIPDYAGLIYINEDFKFDVIKKPKLLHNIKANEKLIRKIAHNLSCKLIFNKIK